MNDLKAMLPTDCTPDDAERLIASRDWMVQKKEDGVRVLLRKTATGVDAFNRKGEPREVPAYLLQLLDHLPTGTVLDGEQLWSGPCVYVVFDLLQYGDLDWRGQRADQRYEGARRIVEALNSPVVSIVPCALITADVDDKRAFIARLQAAFAEGIILRKREAPYKAGRTESLKRLKWKKRAEVILQRRFDDKASFEMFVLDNGKRINVGSVSAHNHYNGLAPGMTAIGEVEYLYATNERKLVQPSLQRFRGDKGPADCTVDQLVIGGRHAEVVHA